jgi:hypothetical protein
MREKKEWERVGEEEKSINKDGELGFGLTSLALET